MISLLIGLLVFLLIAGLCYWVASLLLPHPFPVVVLVVIVIIALIWLVGNAPHVH